MHFPLNSTIRVPMIILGTLLILSIGFSSNLSANTTVPGECGNSESTSPFLQAVETFAINVLKNGIDQYGETHSPLFVDGISVIDGAPVRWDYYEDESWIISNFASQQNLMRVFYGLSELTGEECYKQAAADAVKYMFDHQTGTNGLLYWGGHQFVDLQTMQNHFQSRPHELKNHFPFYEFMWEVDPVATQKMLEAIWNAHILDWGKLDLNRHGEYDLSPGKLWDHSFDHPEPFFEGEGLTFINAGSDMVQAAMSLYHLDNNEDAQRWAERLYKQYVNARHPETGLGVYQYSQPKQRNTPPEEGPLEEELTYSSYGDRAKNQFGSEYGAIALEGNVLWGRRANTIYGRSSVILLHIAEQLEGTVSGKNFLKWTIDGIKAFIDYGYQEEENSFMPMWTDGQDLSGEVFPRTGYYGEKGTEFPSAKPGGPMMIAFARSLRLTGGDSKIWNVMRHMFIDEGLGDPGQTMSESPSLNLNTNQSDPDLLITTLEVYRTTGNTQYLELAEVIGKNILEEHFFEGYFIPSNNHIYTRFDSPEPLALLHLIATKQGKSYQVPAYLTGAGETEGEKFVEGMDGRPSDSHIYEETIE